jgi:hypothetical protein
VTRYARAGRDAEGWVLSAALGDHQQNKNLEGLDF